MAAVIHPAAKASAVTSLPTSYLSETSSSVPASHSSSFLCLSHPKPKTKPQNLPLFTEYHQNPTVILSESPPPLKPISNSKLINSTETQLPDSDYSHLLHLSVLNGDTELAKTVHAAILKLPEDSTYLSNAIISAYFKLFRLSYANRVFATLCKPDVVSYTAMISGFAKSNREIEAIDLFVEMRDSGIEPNEYTFVSLLTACMRLLDLELGHQVHAFVVKLGFLDCTFVANALMGLYSSCGCLDSAIEVFKEMPMRDIASWNTVISILVKKGMSDEAFQYFRDMFSINGLRADYFTLSSVLVACSVCARVREGREIHGHAIKIGYLNNLSVNNALIRFYTKFGAVEDVNTLFGRMPVKDVFTWTEMITAYMEFGLVNLAEETFDMMPEKNCVSYNALLGGYCQNDQGLKALSLFCSMVEKGIELNDFTLTTILKACALTMQEKTSEQIHGFVLKFGFGSNDHIEAALLDMCTWCGRMSDAEKILHQWPLDQKKSIALTSMICGYARNTEMDKAISLLSQGRFGEQLALDEVASTTILGICGTLGLHKFGEQIHCCSLKKGYLSDVKVGNSVISMYSKCGEIKDAIKAFDVMPVRDIVSWNSLLAGHILHRQGDEALAVWKKMEEKGIKPDSITCLYVISAHKHTSLNLVGACHRFFNFMDSKYNIQPSSEHYGQLVGVLGYWGLLDEAEKAIHGMPFLQKASAWRVLLDCCRMHLNVTVGQRVAKEILSIEPQDPSTFILRSNILSASGRWQCSELVREEMREKGFRKLPGRSWIIHENKIHSFFARDISHPLTKDIHSGLEILILECLKSGYVPDTSFVLHEVEEYQKKDFLFYHSAKLVVTYGLLMTKPGKPLRVMKNILLCGDCHTFLKHVSVVTKREIHVRDPSGFHCFSGGKCTCKEPR